MKLKRYVIVSAAVLAAGAGGAGAIAATSDDGKKAEQSVLDDAAKRLSVTPEALRSALGAAEDAQIDQAVKDGKLTQAQADAIKAERAKDGRVLGGPGGGRRHGGPGGFGHGPGGPGGFGASLDAAASALGLTQAELRTKLEAGKSIADVAKDQSKSLDDVKAAIKAAVTKKLDAAVTAGDLTAAQRTERLAELDEHLDELVNRTPPKRGEKPAFSARRGYGHA